MRVLVIEDDDAQTAAYMVKGLTEAGHTVDHAPNGRDGLFLGTSGDYDAMIVDRMLPGLDGIAVIQALRGRQRGGADPDPERARPGRRARRPA